MEKNLQEIVKLKIRDVEIANLTNCLENEKFLVQKLQRQIEILKIKIEEFKKLDVDVIKNNNCKFVELITLIDQLLPDHDKSNKQSEVATKHEDAFNNFKAKLVLTINNLQHMLKEEISKNKKLCNEKLQLSLIDEPSTNVKNENQEKTYEKLIQTLQNQLYNEQQLKINALKKLSDIEQRFLIVQTENENFKKNTEKDEQQTENKIKELKNNLEHLTNINIQLETSKQKLELDLQHEKIQIKKLNETLKSVENRAKVLENNASQLMKKIIIEQEQMQIQKRQQKLLENRIKDYNLKIEEMENLNFINQKRESTKTKNIIEKLENKLLIETQRYLDAKKNLQDKDSLIRKYQFQIDENNEASKKMTKVLEKLQTKIKIYKQQADKSKQLAITNLNKYRNCQNTLEETEKRANNAESLLSKSYTESLILNKRTSFIFTS